MSPRNQPNYIQLRLLLIVLASLAPFCCIAQVQETEMRELNVLPLLTSLAAPMIGDRAPIRGVELSVGNQHLSNGYGTWRDTTLRGVYEIDAHVLQAELSDKTQFGQAGTFLGVADSITLNQDWFTRLSIGAGDGAFYLPKTRVDAFINRKWLPNRNLISSLGYGYYSTPDGHIDRSITVSGIYYFQQPWIIEAGMRFNQSSPGAVSTNRKFAALTYGRDKQDLIVGRYGWGGEGYQAIAQNTALVNFDSREAGLSWRHWLRRDYGFLVGVERYINPSYERNGVNVGVFLQF